MDQDLVAGKAVFFGIPVLALLFTVFGVWVWGKGWWYVSLPVMVVAGINWWQTVVLMKWKYKDKMTYEQILYSIGGGIPAYMANTLMGAKK